ERVDVLEQGGVVEQLAEVAERLGLGPLLGLRGELGLVDVAEGDDLHEVAGVVDVAVALAADADPGDGQLAVGAGDPGGGERRAGEEVPERRGPGSEGLPAGDPTGHGREPPGTMERVAGMWERGGCPGSARLSGASSG